LWFLSRWDDLAAAFTPFTCGIKPHNTSPKRASQSVPPLLPHLNFPLSVPVLTRHRPSDNHPITAFRGTHSCRAVTNCALAAYDVIQCYRSRTMTSS
jgi:hypothetical protein